MLSLRIQKVKSRIWTVFSLEVWKADPFEAKWSVLAKTYSILCGDRDKAEDSLDTFFDDLFAFGAPCTVIDKLAAVESLLSGMSCSAVDISSVE